MVTIDFVKLLNTLSVDPILAAAFREDADKVLSTSLLSVEEKELLKSGDPEKIHLALSATEDVLDTRCVAVIQTWGPHALRH